jgi:hypothetical protein
MKRWPLAWRWVVSAIVFAAACSDGDPSTGEPSGAGGSSSTTGPGGAEATGGDGSPAGGGGSGGDRSGTGGVGGLPCRPSLPVLDVAPGLLSETGLYDDIATGVIAGGVREFEPRFALWSDGATKSRYAYLPECDVIDTTNMDDWQVPIGARYWKEFVRDGVRVETRLIARKGPLASDWVFATYAWQGSDATRIDQGASDVLGTGHDIPPTFACPTCHKEKWRILGFGAIQLSHAGPGLTVESLSLDGLLTTPAPDGFAVPGDAAAQAALGYLHANCGNCHFDTGVPNSDMRLKLQVGAATVEATDTFVTAVDVPASIFGCGGCDRIEPGDAAASAVVIRMSTRGDSAQMPPLGTEVVDDAGVAAVAAWIDAL